VALLVHRVYVRIPYVRQNENNSLHIIGENMKAPITINILYEKKVLFESLREIHGLTFTDLMDHALDKVFSKYAPAQVLEMEISKKEQELAGLRQDFAQAKIVEQQIQHQQKVDKNDTKEIDLYLEQMRNEKFEKYQDSIAALWKKNSVNWKSVVNAYMFKDVDEAKRWYRKKLIETGTIQ